MEKKVEEIIKDIYGQQTTSVERFGRLVSAWRLAAILFAAAFLITLGFLLYFMTHPLNINVRGLPIRGVGGFGVNIVTKEQLAEFGKNVTYLLCNMGQDNVADRFDALKTVSAPDWQRQLTAMLPATEAKFRELQLRQACSVLDKQVEVKVIGNGYYSVRVPAEMTFWIKDRETTGKRFYTFTVRPCQATGENPYGFCIVSWEIEDVKR